MGSRARHKKTSSSPLLRCRYPSAAAHPYLPAAAPLQGFGVHHALNPNPYRGVFGNDGPAYARDMEDLIKAATPGEQAVAGQAGRAAQAGVRSRY